MIEVEVVLDVALTIGESPLWCDAEAALYFIDIKAPALFRLHPASGQLDRWRVTSDLGAFTLLPDRSGALVALRSGLARLDFATGRLEPVAPAPFDPDLFRFNEGGCDPDGRFWVGVMFDPVRAGRPPHYETLHSYTTAEGLRSAPDVTDLHNGMAWSADGERMFLSHSNQRRIHTFGCDGGRLGPATPFAIIPEGDGIPDGAALDTAGGYWCALHGGGALRRFHPDGTHDRDIPLPVSQPTMCSFGGPDLRDLYVTSATDKLTPVQRRAEPRAGAVFRLRPGERGVSRRCTLAPAS